MSFIMCNRNEILVSEILNKNSNAFILLYFIAMRAWRGPGRSPRDCDIGEALIGDYSTMGMTQQNYRTAKKHLERMGFITTRSTTKGTIAKLINTELFDPNFDFGNEQINGQLTGKQRLTIIVRILIIGIREREHTHKMKMNVMNQYQTRRKSSTTATAGQQSPSGTASIITSRKRSNYLGSTVMANSSTGGERSSLGSTKTGNH